MDDQDIKLNTGLIDKELDGYYYERVDRRVNEWKEVYSKIYYTPAAEVEDARRELACLDYHLIHERAVYADAKDEFKSRWAAARLKDEAMNKSYPSFESSYKDSLQRQERCIQQAQKELVMRDEKAKDVAALKIQVDNLEHIKKHMEQRVTKFQVFNTYLDRVKNSSQGEYSDIRDIMDRFGVLTDARNALIERNAMTIDTVHRRHKALEKDVLTKSNEVLAYRNYLSELQSYYALLQDQLIRLNEHFHRIKTTAAERTLNIGSLKMGTNNLYVETCKQMHRARKLSHEDTIGQLNDIRLSMREMAKLARDIKHMVKMAGIVVEEKRRARQKQKALEEKRKKALEHLGLQKNAQTSARAAFLLPTTEEETPKNATKERRFSRFLRGDRPIQ